MATAIPYNQLGTNPYDLGAGLNQNPPTMYGVPGDLQPQDWWSQNAPPVSQPMNQAAPAGGFNLDWLKGLIGNQPWNQQTFNSLIPQFQQYGIQVTPPNAEGDQTKINIPGQGWVRVGFGEGQPVWIPQGDSSGASSSMAGLGSSPADIMAQDPGYQFRLDQGLQGLQRSAAARGTLLTGGTLKALDRYNQDYATGAYQNVFNNNFNLAQLGKPQG